MFVMMLNRTAVAAEVASFSPFALPQAAAKNAP